MAFYSFVAFLPALIAAVASYGLVADPAQVDEQIRSLSERLPEETAILIAEQLREITNSSDRALGVGLVGGVLGALFRASRAVANLIKAVNLAYDEEETRGSAPPASPSTSATSVPTDRRTGPWPARSSCCCGSS